MRTSKVNADILCKELGFCHLVLVRVHCRLGSGGVGCRATVSLRSSGGNDLDDQRCKGRQSGRHGDRLRVDIHVGAANDIIGLNSTVDWMDYDDVGNADSSGAYVVRPFESIPRIAPVRGCESALKRPRTVTNAGAAATTGPRIRSKVLAHKCISVSVEFKDLLDMNVPAHLPQSEKMHIGGKNPTATLSEYLETPHKERAECTCTARPARSAKEACNT
ncbi:hypothetical protein C8R43DRAFT_944299 [Mycena crocata]|nr:hypothetical protein C8R43DRAFT_944299 [Mycena crocata]